MNEEHQLPTKEDLQRLYEKRGHGAVITYAYRNALRKLSCLVCEDDLTEIWQKNTVQHCYGIFGGLLLIKWIKQQTNNFETENTSAILDEIDDVFHDFIARSDSALISRSNNIDCNFILHCISSFKFVSIIATDSTSFSFNSDKFIQSSYCSCKDFECLEQGYPFPSLWYDKKPEYLEILKDKLITQLNQLNLDFLANDIKCLWEDKTIGVHGINYTKKYSERVTNSARKLRRTIIEGLTEKLTATRVLLLGAGGAGKTTLADRLNNQPISKTIEYKSATIGINYNNHQAIDLNPFGIDEELQENLQLYLWDFGGQGIFHGLHNAFLHENCVYVIVVDSRHEQAPDEWLYQIQNVVGSKNPPVLIVTNIYENCNLKQNETRLLREFPNLLNESSFYYFPCSNPNQEGFNKFVNQLVNFALKSQYEVLDEMITIKNIIQNELASQIFIKQHQLISRIKQLDLKKFSNNSDNEELMEDLRSLGFIVCLKEGRNQFCLKPEWTVDNAYLLLHRLRKNATNGLANESMIAEIMDINNHDFSDKLLDFLQDRQLCYLINTDKKTQYFFPDASSTNEPEKAEKILNEKNKIQCYFNLPYIPLGLHARLVSEFSLANNGICIQYHDGDTQDVWREGFIVSNQDNSIQAMVSYYYRKSYIIFTYTGEFKYATTIFKKLYEQLLVSFNGKRLFVVSLILSKNNHYNMNLKEFLNFMKDVKGYEELRDNLIRLEGASMKDNTNVTIHGDVTNSPLQIDSDNSSIVANYVLKEDETKQLRDFVNELVKHKDKFDEEQQEKISTIKYIANKEELDKNEQGILKLLWNELRENTSFANNITQLSSWIVVNSDKIASVLSNIPC